jgi:hypothetical protein
VGVDAPFLMPRKVHEVRAGWDLFLPNLGNGMVDGEEGESWLTLTTLVLFLLQPHSLGEFRES